MVLGSIPELGKWKQPIHLMDWTAGDLWVSKQPVTLRTFNFNYKYAIFKNNYKDHIGWERGVDRIADLEVIPDDDSSKYDSTTRVIDDYYEIEEYLLKKKFNKGISTKRIRYYDDWEKYEVSFTILVPREEQVEEVIFRGDKINCENVVMERMRRPFEWMNVKYG